MSRLYSLAIALEISKNANLMRPLAAGNGCASKIIAKVLRTVKEETDSPAVNE